jgi:malonyl CoA-acyl carrier protein transacylase
MATRIYVFPGQGSQKLGMGADLFPRFPAQVALANAELGWSIEELCLRDPQSRLNQTQFTQPALFLISALSFLNHIIEKGTLPHFAAGHSLGEYAALFAAGVFDLPTALRLVKKRGELMGEARNGAMAAVVGIGVKQIQDILAGSALTGIDIANLNSPLQTVISGPESEIDAAQSPMESGGAQLYRKLPVSAAFHSRYMRAAGDQFRAFLETVSFRPPRFPVISNVTAEPYTLPTVNDLLSRQITEPVRWTETILWLLQRPAPEFSEIGPGNVLTGLIRRIKTEAV